MKGQEEFIERFKKHTGEPFATQDALCGYGHTWILKEALEAAGAADKLKVAEAIREMNLTDRPGRACVPGPDQVRRKGPPRERADDLRAMAEGRADHGLPGGPRAGEAVLAEELSRPKSRSDRSRPAAYPASAFGRAGRVAAN